MMTIMTSKESTIYGKTCLPTCHYYYSHYLERPSRMRLLLLTTLLYVALTTGGANSEHHDYQLRMVRKLIAPPIVDPREEQVKLHCDYDLHGKQLYSVNWYKNDKVLFRYSPSLTPALQVFENEAASINVNVSSQHSNETHLVILGSRDINKNIGSYEGTYTCEVSTEKPFLTDYAMANITVAILPKYKPVLEGVAHNYEVGEQLDAVCTTAPSLPPAELTFYLNNKKVDSPSTQRKKSLHKIGDAVTSRLSMSLRLDRHHFPGGNLHLACHATLPGITLGHNYTTDKTATLAANNQRLEAAPPKTSASSASVPLFKYSYNNICLFVTIIMIPAIFLTR